MTHEWLWLSGPGVPKGKLGLTVLTAAIPVCGGPRGVRHLDFADPPGTMSPAKYEEIIRGAADDSPTRAQFVELMIRGLSADLVAHGCEPVYAETQISEFARRVWDEQHDDGG